jgi:peroxiredoxin Q/BCP
MRTIEQGAQAPDFELPDQDGNPVRLRDVLAGGPVVLFFYPAAMTGGCTKEACHFRDLAQEFAAAGARRLGISVDPVAKQRQFADAHGFDYPLLSDESGDVARAFGVKRRHLSPVKRATFVIDPDRTVRSVVTSELNMDVHADRALAALRAPAGGAGRGR